MHYGRQCEPFSVQNAPYCRILRTQSKNFSGGYTPDPHRSTPWWFDPYINFCLARQRSHCFDFTKMTTGVIITYIIRVVFLKGKARKFLLNWIFPSDWFVTWNYLLNAIPEFSYIRQLSMISLPLHKKTTLLELTKRVDYYPVTLGQLRFYTFLYVLLYYYCVLLYCMVSLLRRNKQQQQR